MELKFGVSTILYKYSDLTKFEKIWRGHVLSLVDLKWNDPLATRVGSRAIVQSFYHKKRVNLGLIAREGFSNVSYIKKCALQHTKSLKESD